MIEGLVSAVFECMDMDQMGMGLEFQFPPDLSLKLPQIEIDGIEYELPDYNVNLPSLDMPGLGGLVQQLIDMIMEQIGEINQFIPPDQENLPSLNMFDLSSLFDIVLSQVPMQQISQQDLPDISFSNPDASLPDIPFEFPEMPGIPGLPSFPDFDPTQMIMFIKGLVQGILEALKSIIESIISLSPKLPSIPDIQGWLLDGVLGSLDFPDIPDFIPDLIQSIAVTLGCIQGAILDAMTSVFQG